jgi:hypothetical protein
MRWHSRGDTERLSWWSGFIVSAGVLLTFMQLGAQIAISVGWITKPGGDLGQFYIGVVVLLIGVGLMTMISLASRPRSSVRPADWEDRGSGI